MSKSAIDAWLEGKPPTVRFIIAEYGDSGAVRIRAGSDQKYDDGPEAFGANHAEALAALEALLARKLFE